jgi:hypothetical protein
MNCKAWRGYLFTSFNNTVLGHEDCRLAGRQNRAKGLV